MTNSVSTPSKRNNLLRIKTWPAAKLGEVIKKSDDWIQLDPVAAYKELSVRLWGRGVVFRGEVLGGEVGNTRRIRVRTGQFILSRIYARNGALGLVPEELDGAIVSNDFPAFNTNPERLLPQFLGWLARTKAFVDSCRAVSEGTTNRVRLKEEEFLRIEIHLPPLSEQHRIVKKIERLVRKIEKARRLERSVDEALTSLTLSLHHKLSGKGMVEVEDLMELYEDRRAVSPEENYPQVGIKGFGGGLFPKSSLKGSDTKYKYFNRLNSGQIVLSQVKGWEGAIAVCDPKLEGYYASPEYRTFSCKSEVCEPAYMDYLVRTSWFHGMLRDATRGQGARRERTRPELFLKIKLTMPDIRAQRWAVTILRKLYQIQSIHAQNDSKLDALLPSILDKAFRGEF